MSGKRQFRVLKKKDTAIMYIAMVDLLEYFRELREKQPTTERGMMLEELIDDFSRIIYKGLEE